MILNLFVVVVSFFLGRMANQCLTWNYVLLFLILFFFAFMSTSKGKNCLVSYNFYTFVVLERNILIWKIGLIQSLLSVRDWASECCKRVTVSFQMFSYFRNKNNNLTLFFFFIFFLFRSETCLNFFFFLSLPLCFCKRFNKFVLLLCIFSLFFLSNFEWKHWKKFNI